MKFPETFLKDIAQHEMQVIRDDGLHRHLRFKRPGTTCMHFDLVTWPGYLAYSGDMGCYVFTRLADMFEFFRGEPGEKLYRMDRRYWAEKIVAADRDGVTEFSEEKFDSTVKRLVLEWVREHRDETTSEQRRDLWDAVMDEVIGADGDSDGSRKQIAANDFSHKVHSDLRFRFHDLWEHNFTTYTHRFNWCCCALRWAIAKYDAKALEAA